VPEWPTARYHAGARVRDAPGRRDSGSDADRDAGTGEGLELRGRCPRRQASWVLPCARPLERPPTGALRRAGPRRATQRASGGEPVIVHATFSKRHSENGQQKAALRRLVVWGLRPPVHAVGVISPGRAVSGNSIPITRNPRPGYGQRQSTGSPAERPCRRALR
jgi:hypothetical protein